MATLHSTATLDTTTGSTGEQKAKGRTTPAGLEPTRDEPSRFLVDRLNRSATVSFR